MRCYRQDRVRGFAIRHAFWEHSLTRPPPNESEPTAHALHKWRLIIWFWIAQAALIALLVPFWIVQGDTVDGSKSRPLGELNPDKFARVISEPQLWVVIVVALAILMSLQTILIWPVRKPRPRNQRGWPLRLSIGVAALVGTALAGALYLGLGTLVQILEWQGHGGDGHAFAYIFFAWIALSYIGGSILMYRFCTRNLNSGLRHEDLLARIASTLFIGTLVEAVAIMPIDIMFRRRQDCYCLAGTFWAYILLLASGLVTLGPAILLPVLTRRRKRWYASRCDCCGYDMTGIINARRTIDRCPECGVGWKRDVQHAPEPVYESDTHAS